MQPVAKRNDPHTSWDAGESFTKHNIHYQIIAEALECCGRPVSSAELAQVCELSRFQIARRLPEMERKNLVARCDPMICSVTKRMCVRWAAVEKVVA